MLTLKLSDIAKTLGGALGFEQEITEIVTDSRKALPNTLFVAIRGDNMDGNLFAAAALDNGAAAVVVEQVMDKVDKSRAIVVPNTKEALIELGGLHRSNFDIPFVAVTGSVGKTTTKDFIYTVLSAKYNTHRNEGNQNNEIGVPNTLFALTAQHEAAVIEMGMCGFGEIRSLVRQVKPKIGVITSIGVSHIEQLGSRENILKAKLEICEGLPDGAPLFLCGDNDLLCTVRDERLKIYRYGIMNKKCDIRAFDIANEGDRTRFTITSPWGEYEAVIPTVGNHNVMDALAAFSVGCVMGIEPLAAARALTKYTPSGMRQKVVHFNGYTVVEDCYNCSPDSLRAAALTLSSYTTNGRSILVVSDMLELGEKSAEMHLECGRFIAKQQIDMLFACGELSKNIVKGAESEGMERCFCYDNKQMLADALIPSLRKNDVVWFKASRGMRLEEVIEKLYERGEKA